MINLLKANKMKKISILLASLIGVLTLMTSCNDEWKDEQYTHYVSFKAQLNDNGVTSVCLTAVTTTMAHTCMARRESQAMTCRSS